MKKLKLMVLGAAMVLVCVGCAAEKAQCQTAKEVMAGEFVILDVDNPKYQRNELFPAFEYYYSPRIRELRNRYNLDAVVAGETDEWKRIRLLRNWLHTNMNLSGGGPVTPVRLEAFAIIDASLKGARFHCTHTSIALPAILNSYGYVARRLGCGYGLKDKGDYHGVNEVWVNKFCKWVLVDAEFDWHFEKDGVPLSALEIRDEYWKDEAKSVVRKFGPENETITDQYKHEYIGTTAETYRWCSWETNTNHFTAFPASLSSVHILYEDDIFRENIWYRGGKPNWLYNTPYLLATPRRDWIEWTPNVISSKVNLQGDKAKVLLTSFTPNLRSYQLKCANQPWTDCSESVELPLEKKLNRFTFRTVNLFGVTGPEHNIEIAWRS